jgi:uncharacterized protein YjbJ (UPF0337 family)
MVRLFNGYVSSGGCRHTLTGEVKEDFVMGAVDKIKHKAQVAKGRVKSGTGRATDNPDLEVEGKGDQVAGNLKQAGDKVKDALKR